MTAVFDFGPRLRLKIDKAIKRPLSRMSPISLPKCQVHKFTRALVGYTSKPLLLIQHSRTNMHDSHGSCEERYQICDVLSSTHPRGERIPRQHYRNLDILPNNSAASADPATTKVPLRFASQFPALLASHPITLMVTGTIFVLQESPKQLCLDIDLVVSPVQGFTRANGG